MKDYCAYMDSVSLSNEQRRQLLQKLKNRPSGKRHMWKLAPLAACLAFVVAVSWAVWPRVTPGQTPQPLPQEHAEATQPAIPETDRTPADNEQDDQAFFWLMTESMVFADATQEPEIAADIALPDGYFFEDMTEQQIARMLGSGDEISWVLGWDGYDVSGRITYGGDGSVFVVNLYGENPDGLYFTMQLAPGALPPTCVVTNDKFMTSINGVETEAYYHCYDCDGDDINEYVYQFSMLPGDVGVRFEAVSEDEDSANWLALQAANWCARWTDGLTMEHLVPESIPEWRSDDLTSEQSARAEDLGAYLPQDIPRGFVFEGAWRELGQGRDYLSAFWSSGMRDINVTVSRPEQAPKLMDPNRPEWYDVRLYEIPWGESVPEEAKDAGFFSPVFDSSQLTADIVAARLYEVEDAGDVDGYRISLGIWYEGADVLVKLSAKGLAKAQAHALVIGR